MCEYHWPQLSHTIEQRIVMLNVSLMFSRRSSLQPIFTWKFLTAYFYMFDVRIVTTQTYPLRIQKQIFKSLDKMIRSYEHCTAVGLSPGFGLESDFLWTWNRVATQAILRRISVVPVCGLCILHDHHTHCYLLLSVFSVTEIMLLHRSKPQYLSVDVNLHAVIYIIWTWTCTRRLRTWTFTLRTWLIVWNIEESKMPINIMQNFSFV